MMQSLDIYRKILTNGEGIELGRPVGIILGVIVADGMLLLDWFWDGIELLLVDNEEDNDELPALDGLDDEKEGWIDGIINGYTCCPYEWKQNAYFSYKKDWKFKMIESLDIYRKILTNREGIELDRPVGIILGIIVADGMLLLDWFWDGIELLLVDNEEDNDELPALDGLDDEKEGWIDGIINGYTCCPYEWKQNAYFSYKKDWTFFKWCKV